VFTLWLKKRPLFISLVSTNVDRFLYYLAHRVYLVNLQHNDRYGRLKIKVRSKADEMASLI